MAYNLKCNHQIDQIFAPCDLLVDLWRKSPDAVHRAGFSMAFSEKLTEALTYHFENDFMNLTHNTTCTLDVEHVICRLFT